MQAHLVPHDESFQAYQSSQNTNSCFSSGVKYSTEDGMTFLHNPRDLHHDSPTGAYSKLHTTAFPSTDTSDTVKYAGSYDPSSQNNFKVT